MDGVVAHAAAVRGHRRVIGMETEIGRPRLVRVEEDAVTLAEPCDFPDRIEDPLVGAGGEDQHARLGVFGVVRRDRAPQIFHGNRNPDAEVGVEAGGQVVGDGTGHHDGMMDRLVAIAVEQHGLAGPQQRHQHGFVGGGRAIGDVTALRRTEDLGGESLGIGQRRARFGRGEVAQTVDRNAEIGAEGHGPVFVAEPLQKERPAEGVAGVVARRVPGGAGLVHHIVAQGMPETRLPQGAEQVTHAGQMGLDLGEDLTRLKHPAARRHPDPL
ncbi:MAG: hypothetical protein BWX70_02088 [Verrucomicrobia bacterium ADurb.Bin070]|nr:MAG: hypothetical protein BWX70_02088 [Verrucomicrobia bacterium ADurb.Bin070]